MALIETSLKGYTEIVEILTKAGADVNVKYLIITYSYIEAITTNLSRTYYLPPASSSSFIISVRLLSIAYIKAVSR